MTCKIVNLQDDNSGKPSHRFYISRIYCRDYVMFSKQCLQFYYAVVYLYGLTITFNISMPTGNGLLELPACGTIFSEKFPSGRRARVGRGQGGQARPTPLQEATTLEPRCRGGTIYIVKSRPFLNTEASKTRRQKHLFNLDLGKQDPAESLKNAFAPRHLHTIFPQQRHIQCPCFRV